MTRYDEILQAIAEGREITLEYTKGNISDEDLERRYGEQLRTYHQERQASDRSPLVALLERLTGGRA